MISLALLDAEGINLSTTYLSINRMLHWGISSIILLSYWIFLLQFNISSVSTFLYILQSFLEQCYSKCSSLQIAWSVIKYGNREHSETIMAIWQWQPRARSVNSFCSTKCKPFWMLLNSRGEVMSDTKWISVILSGTTLTIVYQF